MADAMLIVSAIGKTQGPEREFAMSAMVYGCSTPASWKATLPRIKSLYAMGATSFQSNNRELDVPLNFAKLISEKPGDYPLPLVYGADAALRSSVGASAQKLLEVARKESWFSD